MNLNAASVYSVICFDVEGRRSGGDFPRDFPEACMAECSNTIMKGAYLRQIEIHGPSTAPSPHCDPGFPCGRHGLPATPTPADCNRHPSRE